MFPYLILGIALLIAFVLLARWFVTAEPRTIARALRWAFAVIGVLAVLYIVITRQFGLLIWALLLFLPVLFQMRGVKYRAKAARGPTPGQASEINTRFLRMTLDHDTGEMDGEVLEGQFKGRRLSELGAAELTALWHQCRAADIQSAAVLEAYLDRVHGEAWRTGGESAGPGGEAPGPRPGGPMTREEALEILGLEPGAGRDEVIEAHRRLMQKVHPDHGGSNYLAAKINEAKDLLLGR